MMTERAHQADLKALRIALKEKSEKQADKLQGQAKREAHAKWREAEVAQLTKDLENIVSKVIFSCQQHMPQSGTRAIAPHLASTVPAGVLTASCCCCCCRGCRGCGCTAIAAAARDVRIMLETLIDAASMQQQRLVKAEAEHERSWCAPRRRYFLDASCLAPHGGCVLRHLTCGASLVPWLLPQLGAHAQGDGARGADSHAASRGEGRVVRLHSGDDMPAAAHVTPPSAHAAELLLSRGAAEIARAEPA